VEVARGEVGWRPWGASLFEEAAREQKLVVLHLGARWCHWCHVMERDTYGDARVQAALEEGFVAAHVDQEDDLALANRYERYAWPATIIFDAQGRELFLEAGYIKAEAFLEVLGRLRADPRPLEGAPRRAGAPEGVWVEAARARLEARYDRGGADWGGVTRALRWECAEYLMRADGEGAERARSHLGASLALVDPAWGGLYQYSTQGSWEHPHYEKLMVFQAEGLRAYALGWARWGEPRFEEAARAQVRYLLEMLRGPEGAFYASQDADLVPGQKADAYFRLGDAARRAQGVPALNRSLYARENGQAIRALAAWYAVSGDERSLEAAVAAAEWALARRALPGGGFAHGEDAGAGPFLGDTLAMGEAFLQLYEVTGERRWLERSLAAAEFVLARFRGAEGGFVTAAPGGEAVAALAPAPQLEENVGAARWLNALGRVSGRAELVEAARGALGWLARERAWEQRACAAGPLLVEQELRVEPVHVTVVGGEGDPAARALFMEALRYPLWYRRVEWWDPAQGPLPNPDAEYPQLGRAAAFLCANGVCSAPVFAPEGLRGQMDRFAEALRPGF
jgi:uncharacterized protein YyaL (SSP411 family)